MIELVDITENLTRCVENLNDICDELLADNSKICRLYAEKIDKETEVIDAVKRILFEISEK